MSEQPPRASYVFYAITLILLTLDQVTKAWVQDHLALYQSQPLIPGLFALTHVTNLGAAFSMMWGKVHLLALVAGIVAVAILCYERQLERHTYLQSVSLGLILGGALGNLVDRIRIGHVVDMLDTQWNGRNIFPVFNIADTGICCGMALLMLAFFLESRRLTKQQGLA